MKTIAMLFAFALAAVSGSAIAQSGGTDSKGCHTDHKTGGYHCH